MTYNEIKKIKGHLYKYKRTSYRINGQVKHTSKYVGPVEPVQKRKKPKGRKPSIFVRKLTQDELSKLNKGRHSSKSFEKDRANIILLSAEGKNVNEICKSLTKNRKTVTTAIKAFEAMGINALIRKKPKGAEPKFTAEQRATITQVATTDPRKLGQHFTTWSLRKLQVYLVSENVINRISIGTIRNILRSQKIRYIPSKRWQYSNDPEFSKKNFV